MGLLEWSALVLGGLVLYWIVRRIWTWKEPMSTQAKFITVTPRPPSELDSMLAGLGQVILAIAGLILGLYLFLVLVKFLWRMA